jgi:ferric-dicitrate binding protein FerR (iron transport regulator)
LLRFVAAPLCQVYNSLAALALANGLVGIAVSFTSNISFSMMSLSQQYAAATDEAQRAAQLADG